MLLHRTNSFIESYIASIYTWNKYFLVSPEIFHDLLLLRSSPSKESESMRRILLGVLNETTLLYILNFQHSYDRFRKKYCTLFFI